MSAVYIRQLVWWTEFQGSQKTCVLACGHLSGPPLGASENVKIADLWAPLSFPLAKYTSSRAVIKGESLATLLISHP